MPLDPAQRHQLEQDAITAAWEAERLAACDEAIALLRDIADLDRDDDGDVIIGTDADGHNDLMSRIRRGCRARPWSKHCRHHHAPGRFRFNWKQEGSEGAVQASEC